MSTKLVAIQGSFIDANKILEKRTEITNGIKNQTSSIRTDIKEYSQGSILSFEILSVYKTNEVERVKAKVEIKVKK